MYKLIMLLSLLLLGCTSVPAPTVDKSNSKQNISSVYFIRPSLNLREVQKMSLELNIPLKTCCDFLNRDKNIYIKIKLMQLGLRWHLNQSTILVESNLIALDLLKTKLDEANEPSLDLDKYFELTTIELKNIDLANLRLELQTVNFQWPTEFWDFKGLTYLQALELAENKKLSFATVQIDNDITTSKMILNEYLDYDVKFFVKSGYIVCVEREQAWK